MALLLAMILACLLWGAGGVRSVLVRGFALVGAMMFAGVILGETGVWLALGVMVAAAAWCAVTGDGQR